MKRLIAVGVLTLTAACSSTPDLRNTSAQYNIVEALAHPTDGFQHRDD